MLNKKRWFAVAALSLTLILGASAAPAEDHTKCFTVASLEGNYAVVATYGANVAVALAKRSLDGKGNLTGTFLLNEPTAGSTTGARTLVTGTQMGTYTVNCDGTGVITRVLTAGTIVTTQQDDFVITGAIEKDGELIATSVQDAQRTSSAIVPGGIFVRRVWTRLPQ
jgi:hypothetical protein